MHVEPIPDTWNVYRELDIKLISNKRAQVGKVGVDYRI